MRIFKGHNGNQMGISTRQMERNVVGKPQKVDQIGKDIEFKKLIRG